MLILTRRIGETLIIGKDAPIDVTLLTLRGCQVKIGIQAPHCIKIYRNEVYQQLQAKKRLALVDHNTYNYKTKV